MIGSFGGLSGICVRLSLLELQHKSRRLPHRLKMNRTTCPASFSLSVFLLNSAVNEDDEFVVESFWRLPCPGEWLFVGVVDRGSACSACWVWPCSIFNNLPQPIQRSTYSTAFVVESPGSLVSIQAATQKTCQLTSTPTNLHHHQDH